MTVPRKAGESPGGSSEGPATDSQNVPVIDPTANVRELVEAAIQRQDDLRRVEAEHIREIIQLRAFIAEVRDKHASELRSAEAQRIDAIRAVDVGNVSRAAEVQAAQAATLAAQVSTSAETLRNQVAAAASAQSIALTAALEPIIKDIADLRRAQYEALGQKAQVVEGRSAADDMAPVLAAVARLEATAAAASGARGQVVEQRASTGAIIGYVSGGLGILIAAITLVVLFASSASPGP